MTPSHSPKMGDRGSAGAPHFIDGASDVAPDVRSHARVFTYDTTEGFVAGVVFTVTFTVSHSRPEIWPYLKDFNLWRPGHYYSAIAGDLQNGERFTASSRPGGSGPGAATYEVVRVIPEYVIALQQPIPDEPAIGLGGVPYGFMFMSMEDLDGKTSVTYFGQHESLAAKAREADELSVEKAVSPWQNLARDARARWYESFIPRLRDVVAAGVRGVEE